MSESKAVAATVTKANPCIYTQDEVVWRNSIFKLQLGLGVWLASPTKPLRYEYR